MNVPASQGVHAVPSEPVYPAWQVQFVRRRLPTADKALVGHVEQLVDPIDVGAVE